MIPNIVAIESVLRLLVAFSIVVLYLKKIFWGIVEVALLLIVSVLMIACFYNIVRFEGFLKFDFKGIPH